jgi:hypothetical protein
MRTLVAAALVLALGAMPAVADNPQDNQGLEVGSALSASYLNLVYTPAKVVLAVVGAVGGGVAAVLTGGDQRAAYAFWVPLMGGDFFLRPENFNGGRPLAFFGSDYQERPSTVSSENDASYAYDALYN